MRQEELVAWEHSASLVQQEAHCNLASVLVQQYMLALVQELLCTLELHPVLQEDRQQEHHR